VKYTLKHRLIGAAILTAVAVIFLPSFFKEKQADPISTKSQIPTRPSIAPVEFTAPQPVANIEPAPSPETMFIPDDTATVTQAATPATSASQTPAPQMPAPASKESTTQPSAMPLNAQGLPDAWVVQVGSFSSKEAANKMRDSLQADGIKAYVRTIPNGSSAISRVYIGPKLNKAQAQAIKMQMDKRLKVNSMVLHFQP
jgi:DedD protein